VFDNKVRAAASVFPVVSPLTWCSALPLDLIIRRIFPGLLQVPESLTLNRFLALQGPGKVAQGQAAKRPPPWVLCTSRCVPSPLLGRGWSEGSGEGATVEEYLGCLEGRNRGKRLSERVYLVGGGRFGFGISDNLECHVYLIHEGAEPAFIDAGARISIGLILKNNRGDGLDLNIL
jgi:hypothetical protein